MPDVFSPGSLAKSVHDTLDQAQAAIPVGHHHAVLFDGTVSRADGPAIRGMYIQRTDGGWQIALEGAYDGPHGVAGKVAVAKSW